jgi:hypothetical protein
VALLTALVVGAGCGSADAGTDPAPGAVAGPLVSYERTGGIAGVDDRVVVSSGGGVTVRHRSCSDCFEFRLGHGGHTLSCTEGAEPARVGGVLRILTPLAEGY